MARPSVSTTSVVVIVRRSVRQDAHVSVSWKPSKLTVASVSITEGRHSYRGMPLDRQADGEGTQVQFLALFVRPLVAVVAVNALGFQRALGVVSGAYTPIYNPDLGGREPSEQAKENAEGFAVSEPGVLSECGHARPGDNRVQNDHD